MENYSYVSIFGDDLDIQLPKVSTKKIKKKLEKPAEDIDAGKALKSRKITLVERLAIINSTVHRVLGKQKQNVLVIKTKEQLDTYIANAIASGRIAIDTETNNTTDCSYCQLMGPCFYYPGGKQAYVPINHRNSETKERLSWQLTEKDITEALIKINDSGIKQIFHNAKFDYEVLKCTCGVEMKPYWDTMTCARLLNENELAGLKSQYVTKIDPKQEKYDIEKLFEHVAYADVDPEVFALYSATDAFMTDKLYERQEKELTKDEYGPHLDMTGTRMLPGIRWLFHEVEMPITVVTAEMELTGVGVDEKLGAKLKEKYNELLDQLDRKVDETMSAIAGVINEWRLKPENNEQTRTYVPKKTTMAQAKIEKEYPNIDDDGNRYKIGKSKAAQLDNPVNFASPTQLAILFYDVLEVTAGDTTNRKTGKDQLIEIKEKLAGYLPMLEDPEEAETNEDGDMEEAEEALDRPDDISKDKKWAYAANLASMLLKRRAFMKLITTYIDVIPELAKHWPDGRIRFHLNATGTNTGRYSSGGKWHWLNDKDEQVTVSGINIQNIPSRGDGKICRMLFKAASSAKLIEADAENTFTVPEITEVETPDGFKYCDSLTAGSAILVDGTQEMIKNISYNSVAKTYQIEV